MPPRRPFRLVYRAFDDIEFDAAKSDLIFNASGFDLPYISRIFPGYVLEREDTRRYRERRYQVIGEGAGDVYVVIYTMRGKTCRLITAWRAEREEQDLWYEYTRS